MGKRTTTRLKHIDSLTNNNKNKKNERTIRISEELYQRFREHSSKYYNIETYETILEDLLDCFDKHNEGIRWYNNDKYNDNT